MFSCSTSQETVKSNNADIETDSVEYVLFVDEVDFEFWLVTNNKQMWYYSHNFYKSWNQIFIREFNWRVMQGWDHPFNELIYYDFNKDYGIELDYRLYWYFIFIQEKYNVTLFASSK
jgi:hypothetical protein